MMQPTTIGILLVALFIIGCGARGVEVRSPSAYVTSQEGLELDLEITRIKTLISILRHEHGLLQSDHYTICFNQNRGEDQIIRPRRMSSEGADIGNTIGMQSSPEARELSHQGGLPNLRKYRRCLPDTPEAPPRQ